MTPAERGEGTCGIRPGCCSTHDAASELFDVADEVETLPDIYPHANCGPDCPACILERLKERARAAIKKAGR